MKVLDLSRCHLKSKGFGFILRGLRNGNLLNLESVMLKGNGIGPRGVAYLKEAFESSALDRVKLLDLSENELQDEGRTGISYLCFSFIKLTLGADMIAHMIINGSFRNLQELRLQSNGITDVGFCKLVTILLSMHDTACPSLDRICLQGNRVSAKCKRRLRPYPLYICA